MVNLIAGVLHEQDNELDESVEALIAHWSLAFTHERIARLDARLSADSEESRDHVVGLEETLRVHLEDELLERLRVVALRENSVVLDPLVEQLFALLFKAWRVVEVARLLNARVHHGESCGADAILSQLRGECGLVARFRHSDAALVVHADYFDGVF